MSKIEWTEKTWNPVLGCEAVSPGCRDCYAGTMGRRIVAMGGPAADDYAQVIDISEDRGKLRKGAKAWNGRAVFMPDRLDVPLRRKKPTVFMAPSMSDFFHEDVSFEQIAAILGVMAATTQHTYQVLTKRPERLLKFLRWLPTRPFRALAGAMVDVADIARRTATPTSTARNRDERLRAAATRTSCAQNADASHLSHIVWPLPNVWFGTSIEDQRRFDERAPLLRQVRDLGWHTFVSAEPLIGPIVETYNRWRCAEWVIVGGESGPTARPCNALWMRTIIQEARGAGCKVFVKQLGLRFDDRTGTGIVGAGYSPNVGVDESMRVLGGMPRTHIKSRKGNKPAEWPEDLCIFEMPESMAAALGDRR